MAVTTKVSMQLEALDGVNCDFTYTSNTTDLTLIESMSQRFKIKDGQLNFFLMPQNPVIIEFASLVFIVADQDDLLLIINTPAGSGINSSFKLKAGRPCLIQSNNDIISVQVSNTTGADITGRFFAAGGE